MRCGNKRSSCRVRSRTGLAANTVPRGTISLEVNAGAKRLAGFTIAC
jgi:hypothetical protein